jgi:hypothetical protein
MTPAESAREPADAFSGGVAPPFSDPRPAEAAALPVEASADGSEEAHPAPPGMGHASRSLVDDLRDLASDAQTLLEAERAYQVARASYALSRGKGVAVGLVVAAVLGYFALIALVVGLLLALAPLLTAWGALAAVTLTLALIAFLAFRSAMSKLRRLRTYVSWTSDAGAKP